MSLIPATCAAQISSAYNNTITFPRTGDYSADFATAYNTYATAGLITGAVNTGGTKSIIEAALRASPTTPQLLGTAFAQYWATVALVPLYPNVSAVNDALLPAKVLNFINAVSASISTNKLNPPFEEFISKLEIAAKTILWTITPPSGPPLISGVV